MSLNTFLRSVFAVMLFMFIAMPASAQDEQAEAAATVETPVASKTQMAAEKAAADILGTLQAKGDFETLLMALKKTGVDEVLMEKGPFTLFAPTDEAFASLPEGTLDNMTDEEIAELLQKHVIIDKVTAEQAASLGKAMSVNGESMKIKKMDTSLMVGYATVLEADIMATNGIIHTIDAVLGMADVDTIGKVEAGNAPEETKGDEPQNK